MPTETDGRDRPKGLLPREQVEAAAETIDNLIDRLAATPGAERELSATLNYQEALAWVLGEPNLFGAFLVALEKLRRSRRRRRRRG
jgi:hypothetical protein